MHPTTNPNKFGSDQRRRPIPVRRRAATQCAEKRAKHWEISGTLHLLRLHSVVFAKDDEDYVSEAMGKNTKKIGGHQEPKQQELVG